MKLSRRSFLAAVSGVLAAKALPPPKPQFLGDACASVPARELYLPYMAWDSVLLEPGVPFEDTRLLVPPMPQQFFVERMGLMFGSQDPFDACAESLKHLQFELRNGEVLYFSGPISFLPPFMPLTQSSAPWSLPVPLKINDSDDFEILLRGAFTPTHRSTVGLVLSGVLLYNESAVQSIESQPSASPRDGAEGGQGVSK